MSELEKRKLISKARNNEIAIEVFLYDKWNPLQWDPFSKRFRLYVRLGFTLWGIRELEAYTIRQITVEDAKGDKNEAETPT